MTFLVIANFKSNKLEKDIIDWIAAVAPRPEMVVAPSSLHLHLFPPHFTLAAQDVSPFPMGSYTGAVNARQLSELGVKYCLVGHSERRRYFHETCADVAQKVRELLTVSITPIICMDHGDIAPQFAALDADSLDQCIYCFEPSEDIGGTTIADPKMILDIKSKVAQFVPSARFMYGGSVTAQNLDSLLNIGLSGVLVATASLDPLSFNSLLAKIS
ncbi:MAG: triose-phosphate isomerase family protein [Microgenomates group bacterium]